MLLIKIFLAFTGIYLMVSCNNATQQDKEAASAPPTDSLSVNSTLRPGELLTPGKTYTDTVTFIGLNDEGDNNLFFIQKQWDTIGLIGDGAYNFVKGDQVAIDWKTDSIRYAGDSELLQYTEFLLVARLIKPLTLTDKKIHFLWREKQYDESLKDSFNTIVLDKEYCRTITDPEKAAIAYVATFAGNECSWDGPATPERTNLKCKILTALSLGYQCSNTHLNFLQQWFNNDADVLTELKSCPTTPDAATIQKTFNTINIITKGNIITINFAVQAINIREGKSLTWAETQQFRFEQNNIRLIQKNKSPVNEEKFSVTAN